MSCKMFSTHLDSCGRQWGADSPDPSTADHCPKHHPSVEAFVLLMSNSKLCLTIDYLHQKTEKDKVTRHSYRFHTRSRALSNSSDFTISTCGRSCNFLIILLLFKYQIDPFYKGRLYICIKNLEVPVPHSR